MKLKLCIAVGLLIFSYGCISQGHKNTVCDTLLGNWEIGEYVDDFDKPTGKKYVYQIIDGAFSNSATASSRLRVQIVIYNKYFNDGTVALEGEMRFDEYANGTQEMCLYSYEYPTPSGGKIVDKTNERIFYQHSGGVFFSRVNDETNWCSWLDVLMIGGKYDITIKGDYNTKYYFYISSDHLEAALIEAGLKDKSEDLQD